MLGFRDLEVQLCSNILGTAITLFSSMFVLHLTVAVTVKSGYEGRISLLDTHCDQVGASLSYSIGIV